jgi:glycosyltransferase involved in cell wall biosynthesis
MTEKIRIAHVCEAFGAGIFTAMAALTRNLSHEVFEQHIIYRPRLDFLPPRWRERIHPAIRLHEWRCGREINPLADFKSVVQLHRMLAVIRPDLIHAHSSKAGLVRLLAPLHRAPIIYTPHAFSFLQRHLSGPLRYGLWGIEKLLAMCGGDIIGVSRSEEAAARRVTRRAEHINYAIDGDAIRSAVGESDPGTGRLRIGMIGRVSPQKNFPLFLEAARRLQDRADFYWIGTAAQAPDYVRVSGWQPADVCWKLINDLDIYIHTSLWEGVSIAILEAMSLGKPVVAYDCEGNRDAVIHCKTGFIAKAADDFIAYVALLMESGELRAQFGRAGAQFVGREFSPARHVESWTRAYLRRVPGKPRFLQLAEEAA